MSRNYTKLTIKLLFGQANSCAYPGCENSLIYDDRDKQTVVAEIAHIRSEAPRGPRHDPSYTGDLDGPENLLLLCGVHHKPVDRHDATYSVAELEAWKVAQIAGAGAGTQIPDDDAARFIRLSSEERAAVDKLGRIGYRLEQSANSAATAVDAVNEEYRQAHDHLYASMGPILEVDDDGNRSRISSSSVRLPQAQYDSFQRKFNETLQQHQGVVRELASQLGEEVAVLRMMDRRLGILGTDALTFAHQIVDNFHEAVELAESLEALQSSLRDLYDTARERF